MGRERAFRDLRRTRAGYILVHVTVVEMSRGALLRERGDCSCSTFFGVLIVVSLGDAERFFFVFGW